MHERDVEWDEVVRGYEYAKDQYVVLTDEDFEKLPLPSKHTIELSAFVRAQEIDPIYYEKSYYLEPKRRRRQGVRPADARARREVARGHREDSDSQQGAALRSAAAGRHAHPGDAVLPGRDPRREGRRASEVEVSEREMEMATTLVDVLSEQASTRESTTTSTARRSWS